MLFESFKITSYSVMQVFLLAAIGYFLVKRNILGSEGLNALSRLVIGITLPLLIFCQLVDNFSFGLYPNWWIFPLMSMGITVAGLIFGLLFSVFIYGAQYRLQFLSLITFQNSGYLPLALVASLLSEEKMNVMFIYIFLFLLGFNLIIWSLGVYILTFKKAEKFALASLFSPPVIATLFTLLFIYSGLDKFFPQPILKPLNMVGNCTIPLAMIVLGGNLAQINLSHLHKKAIFLVFLVKLIIFPLFGLLLIIRLKPPELIGLLILMETAMPPATSLSLIIRHFKKEDLLISQGIFFGHLFSIITIPIFLILYVYIYPIRNTF